MINKTKFKITNDKKILHKKGKQWITLSIAMLGLLGGTAMASTVTHADANVSANSGKTASMADIVKDNANHQLDLQQSSQSQSTVKSSAPTANGRTSNSTLVSQSAHALHATLVGNSMLQKPAQSNNNASQQGKQNTTDTSNNHDNGMQTLQLGTPSQQKHAWDYVQNGVGKGDIGNDTFQSSSNMTQSGKGNIPANAPINQTKPFSPAMQSYLNSPAGKAGTKQLASDDKKVIDSVYQQAKAKKHLNLASSQNQLSDNHWIYNSDTNSYLSDGDVTDWQTSDIKDSDVDNPVDVYYQYSPEYKAFEILKISGRGDSLSDWLPDIEANQADLTNMESLKIDSDSNFSQVEDAESAFSGANHLKYIALPNNFNTDILSNAGFNNSAQEISAPSGIDLANLGLSSSDYNQVNSGLYKNNNVSDTVNYIYNGYIIKTVTIQGKVGQTISQAGNSDITRSVPQGYNISNSNYLNNKWTFSPSPIDISIVQTNIIAKVFFYDIYASIDGMVAPSNVTETGLPNSDYTVSAPSGWTLVNPNGTIVSNTNDINNDSKQFKYNTGNQTLDVAPVYKGMTYKYNKNNQSVEFTGGTANSDLSDFIPNANSDIKNATSIKFDSDVNTSNVTNMSSMFFNDPKLQSLKLSNSFNTAKVTDMSRMFYGDSNLQSLILPDSFYTSNVTTMSDMFDSDKSLQSLTLPNSFDTSNVTDMDGIFGYTSDLSSLIIKSTHAKLNDLPYMYRKDTSDAYTSATPNDFTKGNVGTFIVTPNPKPDTISYQYNGHQIASNIVHGTADSDGDGIYRVNYSQNVPANYHLVNQSATTVSDDGKQHVVQVLPNIESDMIYYDLTNGTNVSSIQTQGNYDSDAKSAMDSHVPVKYHLVSGDVGTYQPDGSFHVIVAPNTVTAYLGYTTDGKSNSSDLVTSLKSITKPIGANAHSDIINNVPSGYHLEDTNPQYTYWNGDNHIYSNVIPNSITLQFSNGTSKLVNTKGCTGYGYTLLPSDIPANYHLANGQSNNVSLLDVYNGGNILTINVVPNDVTAKVSFHDIYGSIDGMHVPSDVTETGLPNSDYTVSAPQGWAIVNPDGTIASGTNDVSNDSKQFQYNAGNQTLDVTPVYKGMTYKYDKTNQSLELTGGIANSDLYEAFSTAINLPFGTMNNIKTIKFDSNVNTSNVNNIGGMFWEDNALQNLNLSHFDTSKVTNMSIMFDDDSNLTSLILSNTFDTGKVTDMLNMFADMPSLQLLTIQSPNSKFDNTADISKLYLKDSNDTYTATTPNDFNQGNFGTFLATPNIPADMINYQYNGKTLATQQFKAGTSNYDNTNHAYKALTISASRETGLPQYYHLAVPSKQFKFDDGTYDVPVTPNQLTDTVNYQVDGKTVATQQFKGNDSRANGASDTSFDVSASHSQLPSNYSIVSGQNTTFNYDGGTHNIAVYDFGKVKQNADNALAQISLADTFVAEQADQDADIEATSAGADTNSSAVLTQQTNEDNWYKVINSDVSNFNSVKGTAQSYANDIATDSTNADETQLKADVGHLNTLVTQMNADNSDINKKTGSMTANDSTVADRYNFASAEININTLFLNVIGHLQPENQSALNADTADSNIVTDAESSLTADSNDIMIGSASSNMADAVADSNNANTAYASASSAVQDASISSAIHSESMQADTDSAQAKSYATSDTSNSTAVNADKEAQQAIASADTKIAQAKQGIKNISSNTPTSSGVAQDDLWTVDAQTEAVSSAVNSAVESSAESTIASAQASLNTNALSNQSALTNDARASNTVVTAEKSFATDLNDVKNGEGKWDAIQAKADLADAYAESAKASSAISSVSASSEISSADTVVASADHTMPSSSNGDNTDIASADNVIAQAKQALQSDIAAPNSANAQNASEQAYYAKSAQAKATLISATVSNVTSASNEAHRDAVQAKTEMDASSVADDADTTAQGIITSASTAITNAEADMVKAKQNRNSSEADTDDNTVKGNLADITLATSSASNSSEINSASVQATFASNTMPNASNGDDEAISHDKTVLAQASANIKADETSEDNAKAQNASQEAITASSATSDALRVSNIASASAVADRAEQAMNASSTANSTAVSADPQAKQSLASTSAKIQNAMHDLESGNGASNSADADNDENIVIQQTNIANGIIKSASASASNSSAIAQASQNAGTDSTSAQSMITSNSASVSADPQAQQAVNSAENKITSDENDLKSGQGHTDDSSASADANDIANQSNAVSSAVDSAVVSADSSLAQSEADSAEAQLNKGTNSSAVANDADANTTIDSAKAQIAKDLHDLTSGSGKTSPASAAKDIADITGEETKASTAISSASVSSEDSTATRSANSASNAMPSASNGDDSTITSDKDAIASAERAIKSDEQNPDSAKAQDASKQASIASSAESNAQSVSSNMSNIYSASSVASGDNNDFNHESATDSLAITKDNKAKGIVASASIAIKNAESNMNTAKQDSNSSEADNDEDIITNNSKVASQAIFSADVSSASSATASNKQADDDSIEANSSAIKNDPVASGAIQSASNAIVNDDNDIVNGSGKSNASKASTDAKDASNKANIISSAVSSASDSSEESTASGSAQSASENMPSASNGDDKSIASDEAVITSAEKAIKSDMTNPDSTKAHDASQQASIASSAESDAQSVSSNMSNIYSASNKAQTDTGSFKHGSALDSSAINKDGTAKDIIDSASTAISNAETDMAKAKQNSNSSEADRDQQVIDANSTEASTAISSAVTSSASYAVTSDKISDDTNVTANDSAVKNDAEASNAITSASNAIVNDDNDILRGKGAHSASSASSDASDASHQAQIISLAVSSASDSSEESSASSEATSASTALPSASNGDDKTINSDKAVVTNADAKIADDESDEDSSKASDASTEASLASSATSDAKRVSAIDQASASADVASNSAKMSETNNSQVINEDPNAKTSLAQNDAKITSAMGDLSSGSGASNSSVASQDEQTVADESTANKVIITSAFNSASNSSAIVIASNNAGTDSTSASNDIKDTLSVINADTKASGIINSAENQIAKDSNDITSGSGHTNDSSASNDENDIKRQSNIISSAVDSATVSLASNAITLATKAGNINLNSGSNSSAVSGDSDAQSKVNSAEVQIAKDKNDIINGSGKNSPAIVERDLSDIKRQEKAESDAVASASNSASSAASETNSANNQANADSKAMPSASGTDSSVIGSDDIVVSNAMNKLKYDKSHPNSSDAKDASTEASLIGSAESNANSASSSSSSLASANTAIANASNSISGDVVPASANNDNTSISSADKVITNAKAKLASDKANPNSANATDASTQASLIASATSDAISASNSASSAISDINNDAKSADADNNATDTSSTANNKQVQADSDAQNIINNDKAKIASLENKLSHDKTDNNTSDADNNRAQISSADSEANQAIASAVASYSTSSSQASSSVASASSEASSMSKAMPSSSNNIDSSAINSDKAVITSAEKAIHFDSNSANSSMASDASRQASLAKSAESNAQSASSNASTIYSASSVASGIQLSANKDVNSSNSTSIEVDSQAKAIISSADNAITSDMNDLISGNGHSNASKATSDMSNVSSNATDISSAVKSAISSAQNSEDAQAIADEAMAQSQSESESASASQTKSMAQLASATHNRQAVVAKASSAVTESKHHADKLSHTLDNIIEHSHSKQAKHIMEQLKRYLSHGGTVHKARWMINKIKTGLSVHDSKQFTGTLETLINTRRRADKIIKLQRYLKNAYRTHANKQVIEKGIRELESLITPAQKGKAVSASYHATNLYVQNVRPIELHRSARTVGHQGKAVIKVIPKLHATLHVIGLIKLNGHKRYVTISHGHRAYLTANAKFIRNAYVQPSEIKPSSRIKLRRAVLEHTTVHYTRHNAVKLLRKGKVLSYKRLVTIAQGHMTRFQLLNNHWITANKLFVKMI